jgi:hypothetical protein
METSYALIIVSMHFVVNLDTVTANHAFCYLGHE